LKNIKIKMYIGPWQEFKLARILQLKDRVEKEDDEANVIENQPNNKAYSVGTRQGGGAPPLSEVGQSSRGGVSHFNNGFLSGASKSNYSRGTTNNSSNLQQVYTRSQVRAQSKYKNNMRQEDYEKAFRYKVDK
jgi:hypothetical protein